jgi:hypothetical protein
MLLFWVCRETWLAQWYRDKAAAAERAKGKKYGNDTRSSKTRSNHNGSWYFLLFSYQGKPQRQQTLHFDAGFGNKRAMAAQFCVVTGVWAPRRRGQGRPEQKDNTIGGETIAMEMPTDADVAAMETDNELCVQSSGSPEHGCNAVVPRKMRPKHGVPIH